MFLLSKPLRLRGLKCFQLADKRIGVQVEAFAASWIEIVYTATVTGTNKSKPLRLRGLKSAVIHVSKSVSRRSLCGFVD